MTRMPTAPSSASVARSPCWSWTRRETSDVRALEAGGQRDDRDGGGRDDEAERPVHLEQHQGDHDQLQDVHHQEQQPEAEEPPDARQVVGDPGQQLAGLPLAVEGHRQLLEPRVEVVAHGRSRRRAPRWTAPSAGMKISTASRTPSAEREQTERQQRAEVVLGDRAVDDRPGDQRDRDGQADPGQRGGGHDDQRAQVRAQVAAEPPQRPHACGGVVVRAGCLGWCVRHLLVAVPSDGARTSPGQGGWPGTGGVWKL